MVVTPQHNKLRVFCTGKKHKSCFSAGKKDFFPKLCKIARIKTLSESFMEKVFNEFDEMIENERVKKIKTIEEGLKLSRKVSINEEFENLFAFHSFISNQNKKVSPRDLCLVIGDFEKKIYIFDGLKIKFYLGDNFNVNIIIFFI